MFRKYILLHILSIAVIVVNAQECAKFKEDIDKSVYLIQHQLDSIIKSSGQPDYIESYIIYPVIKRYYSKSKNKDTIYVKKFGDFARTVWCFKGTCFNNNKTFYLNKSEVSEKIKSNDIGNSYLRETICMLCDIYHLDTVSAKKILEYTDTTDTEMNTNANNYSLLHKSLQLVNLKQNKCINQQIYDRYRYSLIDTIYKRFVNPFLVLTTENNFTKSDYNLFTEAILMIGVLDEQINISDEIYQYMINNILYRNPSDNFMDGHATIVTLWTLLDVQKKIKNTADKH